MAVDDDGEVTSLPAQGQGTQFRAAAIAADRLRSRRLP
jgi:hypothetical protein